MLFFFFYIINNIRKSLETVLHQAVTNILQVTSV